MEEQDDDDYRVLYNIESHTKKEGLFLLSFPAPHGGGGTVTFKYYFYSGDRNEIALHMDPVEGGVAYFDGTDAAEIAALCMATDVPTVFGDI